MCQITAHFHSKLQKIHAIASVRKYGNPFDITVVFLVVVIGVLSFRLQLIQFTWIERRQITRSQDCGYDNTGASGWDAVVVLKIVCGLITLSARSAKRSNFVAQKFFCMLVSKSCAAYERVAFTAGRLLWVSDCKTTVVSGPKSGEKIHRRPCTTLNA